MPWIFSYADLGPHVIEKLLGRAPFCALPASLPGYKVVFKSKSRKWGGAIASLEKSRKDFVYGSAFLLPKSEVDLIDKYYKDYEKITLPVFIDATQDKIKAVAYILKASSDYGIPSQEYTAEIVKHLKFFWSQDGKRSLSLEDFGIAVEKPEINKTNIVKNIDKEKTKPLRKKASKKTVK